MRLPGTAVSITATATEGLGAHPVLGRATLQHGVEQGFHTGVAGEQHVLVGVRTLLHLRQHEMVHPGQAEGQVVEADGDAGAESSVEIGRSASTTHSPGRMLRDRRSMSRVGNVA